MRESSASLKRIENEAIQKNNYQDDGNGGGSSIEEDNRRINIVDSKKSADSKVEKSRSDFEKVKKPFAFGNHETSKGDVSQNS